MKKKSFQRLPPDKDTHRLHCQRVNNLGNLKLNYHIKDAIPSPNIHGWSSSNGYCYPVCYARPSLPEDIFNVAKRSLCNVSIESEQEEDETDEAEESDVDTDEEVDLDEHDYEY